MKNYLPKKYHFYVWSILIFQFVLGLEFLLLWSLWAYTIVVLLFLKRTAGKEEEKGMTSPASGKLVEIKKSVSHSFFGENFTEYKIVIPWWRDYGVYFPGPCEVIDVFLDRQEIIKHYFLLQSVDNEPIGMQFEAQTLRFGLQTGLFPGDRGQKKANMGYIPFGGTLFLYLPSKYETLIESGKKLIAGQTILAK